MVFLNACSCCLALSVAFAHEAAELPALLALISSLFAGSKSPEGHPRVQVTYDEESKHAVAEVAPSSLQALTGWAFCFDCTFSKYSLLAARL